MSELVLDPSWRKESTLTSVRLPDGTASGGVLLGHGNGRLLVLFSEEELEVGDRLTTAHDLALTVTAVERGTMTGQRVTKLRVQQANGGR